MKINNDEEHKAALAEISFFEPRAEPLPGTPEEARFRELAQAIEIYENQLWQAMPGPDLSPW